MKDIKEEINNIKIRYKDGKRKLKCCYCDKEFSHSIILHLKKEHLKKWNQWCKYFVKLYNKGWSSKQIMQDCRTKDDYLILSWTVIERAIKSMAEQKRVKLRIPEKTKIRAWRPTAKKYSVPTTTVWNFPVRGKWAVHQSDYRGNWPPQVPRTLILKYSEENNVVFDPFLGGGTTAIEAWLDNRKCIGIDISPFAIKMAKTRIGEMKKKSKGTVIKLQKDLKPIIKEGDVRDSLDILSKIGYNNKKIDLICTHPPYLNILKYTEKVTGDLSRISVEEVFCNEIQKIANIFYKILRTSGYCCILMGDVRKKGKMVPLGFNVMKRFLQEGFELQDIIIKLQHKDKSTEFYYNRNLFDYLIAHEYLFVFKKKEAFHEKRRTNSR